MKKLYIGVDGGGTKSAFAAMDDSGNILGQVELGTTHLMQISQDEFEETIKQGIDYLLKEANASLSEIEHVFCGIPGFGEFEDKMEYVKKFFNLYLPGKVTLGNDCEPGWAGSLGLKSGINMVIGTGSIAYGKNSEKISGRCGGWGPFVGDEASAYWLGRKAITAFSKQSDGRLPSGPLYDIFNKALNLNRDFAIIEKFHDALENQRQEVSKLAKLVYQAALEGDNSAIDIFDEAAFEIYQTVFALSKQLNFDNTQEIFVTLSGGVSNAGDVLEGHLKKYLLETGYNFKLVKSEFEPWQGALLLAFDQKNPNDFSIVEKWRKNGKCNI